MKKKKIIAGVDEAGRGSWIGPVFSAAVILNDNINTSFIKDSKKIPFKNRVRISNYIKANSFFSISKASVKEIEKRNILQATLLSMKRAINKLRKKPNLILVDGNQVPKIKKIKIKAVVRGDQNIPSILKYDSLANKTYKDIVRIRIILFGIKTSLNTLFN